MIAKTPKRKPEKARARRTSEKPTGFIVQPTGIASLDQVLHGGIPQGSTMLIAGPAGTGKTILALQWLFSGHREFGDAGIYVSATEYLTGSIKRAERMSFFDSGLVGTSKINFTDLSEFLRLITRGERPPTREDVFAVADRIFELAMNMEAKRIVVDSITAFGRRLNDTALITEFVFQLAAKLAVIGATVVMISEVADGKYSAYGVEEFIADGIISLNQEVARLYEPIRKLRIVKLRGMSHDANEIQFHITKDGITLFPKVRAHLAQQASQERVTTGIPGLDAMLHGGYFKGSAVLLGGVSGAGKTIFALQCAEGVLSQGKKCLYVSFEESKERLFLDTDAFGWNLRQHERNGLLRIAAAYPAEFPIDEHLYRITALIEEFEPELVVFDSASALHSLFTDEDIHDLLSNLIAFTKSREVTAIITSATSGFPTLGKMVSQTQLSTTADAIILLRQVEVQSALKHGVLIMKLRGSDHERTLREFVFGPDGVRILTDFRGYEDVLSGGARKVSASTEDRLRALFIEVLGPFGAKIFEHEKAGGLDLERIEALLSELGDQGIISMRRKEEFRERAQGIVQGGQAGDVPTAAALLGPAK